MTILSTFAAALVTSDADVSACSRVDLVNRLAVADRTAAALEHLKPHPDRAAWIAEAAAEVARLVAELDAFDARAAG